MSSTPEDEKGYIMARQKQSPISAPKHDINRVDYGHTSYTHFNICLAPQVATDYDVIDEGAVVDQDAEGGGGSAWRTLVVYPSECLLHM